MSLQITRNLLMWCSILNHGMLLVWFAASAGARDAMHRLHGRWFRLSPEQFDAIHDAGMAGYKQTIFLFNLMPSVALHLAG